MPCYPPRVAHDHHYVSSRHRLSYLADDERPTVAEVRRLVRQRGHRPLPRSSSLNLVPDLPQPTGRRIRIVLGDPLATLPVFYGNLPTNAPPAHTDFPSADGCAAADAVTPDAASAVASTPETTRYIIQRPS
jgi:hypothetical protein